MPRLTRPRAERRDRGAVSVWVAVLMIPFLIVAALGIDVGSMHADQQRLQTGADAAALAVAQECSVGGCTAAEAAAIAQQLASANAPTAEAATARVDELQQGWVEVSTSSTRDHWFAPVMGIEETDLGASSAAAWGYPTAGTSVLPFALSWCELLSQAGLQPIRNEAGTIIGMDIPDGMPAVTILSTKHSPSGCYGPSGLAAPGGFGWLQPTNGCGATVTDIDLWARSDTGNSVPGNCSVGHFERWIGHTVFIPVFEATNGRNGNNAAYNIFGYVAFRFEGYYFASHYDHGRPCDGEQRCIRGTFLNYVDLDSDFEFSAGGAPMGAAIVQLRLPEQGGS